MDRLKLHKDIFLHDHPAMEKKYKIPEGHVIIDAETYRWLWYFHSGMHSLMDKLKGEIENG